MLAAGLWRDGRCERMVQLSVPGTAARRSLVESLHDATPAERASALVAAAVGELGSLAPPTPGELGELCVGDRDRILLALRRELAGEQLECVCPCACGETLVIGLSIDALLDAVADEPLPLERETGGLRVRAATGADLEHVASRAIDGGAEAVRELLARCILEPADAGVEALEQASELLEQLDPAAEILLRGACPACGGEVVALLDPGAYLWTELERWQTRLELEIHVLASRYHWSESEIVALAPARRSRYLELLEADPVAVR